MLPDVLYELIMNFIGIKKCKSCHNYKNSSFELNNKPICNHCLVVMLNFMYSDRSLVLKS